MNDPKVGDEVKVVGKKSLAARNLFGRVGRVTSVSHQHMFVRLDIENTPNGGLHFDEIEPFERNLKWTKEGRCPQCGYFGQFIRTAIVCPNHGAYGGC